VINLASHAWNAVEDFEITKVHPRQRFTIHNDDNARIRIDFPVNRAYDGLRFLFPAHLITGMIYPQESFLLHFTTTSGDERMRIAAIVRGCHTTEVDVSGRVYVRLDEHTTCADQDLLKLISDKPAGSSQPTSYVDMYTAATSHTDTTPLETLHAMLNDVNGEVRGGEGIVERLEDVLYELSSYRDGMHATMLDTYQRWAFTKVNAEAVYAVPRGLLLNAALGLTGEAGEFADTIKKIVFHNHPVDSESTHALALELGDILWYVALAASGIGYPLDAIRALNVKKLNTRYPNGFDAARSIHRESSPTENGSLVENDAAEDGSLAENGSLSENGTTVDGVEYAEIDSDLLPHRTINVNRS
jgi:NTP pyrophosphatase (non-canonical NTP hydrolase)